MQIARDVLTHLRTRPLVPPESKTILRIISSTLVPRNIARESVKPIPNPFSKTLILNLQVSHLNFGFWKLRAILSATGNWINES
jgi:hypothetical protein